VRATGGDWRVQRGVLRARAGARMGAGAVGRRMSGRPTTLPFAWVHGRAGRWASGGGELPLRNDHNALERIKSIKIAILGRHQQALGSISNHCKGAHNIYR